ncbi:unnamed protein product [Didymodactylos carnosus]|uniref:Ubiquitin-like protease family profile domain-containing protein n=1 Tax=Didymodactylos carnosus TaxID=1234261 RepID=A0A814AAZ6_9BILA|nr:unnamed protein product [Didymodactylos carnosus]CAF3691686.1 unnamed protein product [Didymodactylos carnosus]
MLLDPTIECRTSDINMSLEMPDLQVTPEPSDDEASDLNTSNTLHLMVEAVNIIHRGKEMMGPPNNDSNSIGHSYNAPCLNIYNGNFHWNEEGQAYSATEEQTVCSPYNLLEPDEWKLYPYIINSTITNDEYFDNGIDKQSNTDHHSVDNNKNASHKDIGSKNTCVHMKVEDNLTSLPTEHRSLIDLLLQRPSVRDKIMSEVPKQPLEKTPSSAVITEQAIIAHVNDLREYGPKQYKNSTNTYIPIIQEVDKTSCVRDYLSYILVPTVSNFIDVELNIISTLKCDSCHGLNLLYEEKHSTFTLRTSHCSGKAMPETSLTSYFTPDTGDLKTCQLCSTRSNNHTCSSEITKLPQNLFFNFIAAGYISGTLVETNQFYLKRSVNMERFLSTNTIALPLAAMYIRRPLTEKTDFTDILRQIINNFDDTIQRSATRTSDSKTALANALNAILKETNVLSWVFAFSYTCLQCTERWRSIGCEYLQFSNESDVSSDGVLDLENKLVQKYFVPNLQCRNCPGKIHTKNECYIISDNPSHLLVIHNTRNAGLRRLIRDHLSLRCELTSTIVDYYLNILLVITEDARTLIVKKCSNSDYLCYNQSFKRFEPLSNGSIETFLAAATQVLLCYKANEGTVDTYSTPAEKQLDISTWKLLPEPDKKNINIVSGQLSQKTAHYVTDRYDLSADDLKNLIQPNYELNDTILNAHLYLTAKLVQNTILFDSVGTHTFIQRGFAAKDFILSHNEWFKNNIVLFPIHHHQSWLMYIINIQSKFIIEFDSALSNTFPKTKYIQSILKLLDIQHYPAFGRKIDFNQ